MADIVKPFSHDNVTEINRLDSALAAAGIGSWEMDIVDNTFWLCTRFKSHFAFSGKDIVPFEELLMLVHEDDRPKVYQGIRNALIADSGGFFDVEIRTHDSSDVHPRWLHLKGQAHFDDQGRPSQFAGILQNVTSQVLAKRHHFESENRFRIMIEQAPIAIGLLSGHEMIIDFGNDKIFEVWGKDKSIIGQSLKDALPEIKGQGFFEMLESVYQSGSPIAGNNKLAKLNHNGNLQDIYFDFAYTPVRDIDNTVTGIMVLASDVTERVTATKAIEKSEAKFRTLIEEAPIATCLYIGRDLKIELANQTMLDYWGKDQSVIGKTLAEALPEIKDQPFLQLLTDVFNTGKPYSAKSRPARLESNGVLGSYYFDFTYKPLFDESGEVYGIMNTAVDVTQQVHAQKALEESEVKLRSVIAAAPVAIGLFVGRDLIIEMPNQAFIEIVGKGPDIVGKPLREVMPELSNQAYLQILDDVFTSGKMFKSIASQVDIVQNGVMTHNFYNISYTPLFNAEGEVYAILDIAIDVTETIQVNHKLEENEQFSRSIFYNSPVAKMVVSGEEMKIVTVNKNMMELMGRDLSIIGKNFTEAIPELADTPLMDRLKNVFYTGITYNQPEEMFVIMRYGKPYTGYYNYIYQALRNASGDVYGIVITATEVTPHVLARKEIREAESIFRDAVELAEMATWSVDPATGMIRHSERLNQWFGMEEDETALDTMISYIPETDRERIRKALHQVMQPDSEGIYSEEHLIENIRTGRRRFVHSQARVFFDSHGKPYKLVGIVRDITEQRQIQLALEQQVQQRTEELATMNEELAAINEEYSATNEELAGSNQLLIRSNESLQRFSYVASHDLQEPLRKIQSFGDLLFNRYGAQLGDGAEYLKRMQTAATRMSVLIDDLLTFSRISTYQDATISVSLNDVLNQVLTDLELLIQETNAVVNIGILPIVHGDQSQLTQLFSNLLSNALKFRKDGTTPKINIEAEIKFAAELPSSVIPTSRVPAYHRINVSDNGIGFDQKNANRIFQVFQRLHGKNEFPGTGIGLAICEKVVANHGGAITATSQLGQGAVFSIYLPL